MVRIYNKKSEEWKRKNLRNSLPKAEIILWQYLKDGQLVGYKFRRQYSIGRYVVDFYCPKVKLVIEVDGPTHFTGKMKKYDKRRQDYIELFGIKLLRVNNLDVYKNIDGVTLTIINHLLKIHGD